MFTTLKTETTTVKLRGIDTPVEIRIATAPDYEELEFDFGNATSNAEYRARFESGELQSVIIRVSCTALGVYGDTYLGACHVANQQDILDTVRDYDLRGEALLELQTESDTMIEQLAPYMNV